MYAQPGLHTFPNTPLPMLTPARATQIMTAVLEKGQRPDLPQVLTELPMGNSMVAAPFIALIQSCWAQVRLGAEVLDLDGTRSLSPARVAGTCIWQMRHAQRGCWTGSRCMCTKALHLHACWRLLLRGNIDNRPRTRCTAFGWTQHRGPHCWAAACPHPCPGCSASSWVWFKCSLTHATAGQQQLCGTWAQHVQAVRCKACQLHVTPPGCLPKATAGGTACL